MQTPGPEAACCMLRSGAAADGPAVRSLVVDLAAVATLLYLICLPRARHESRSSCLSLHRLASISPEVHLVVKQ